MVNVNELKAHIYDVIGVIHKVHKELGPGLNESCYQEGFMIQLDEDKIFYRREMNFHPYYHGKQMEAKFRVDFLCKEDIVVECKAVMELCAIHRAQLFNYLRILKVPSGILVNFLPEFAVIERYFYDKDTNEILSVNGTTIKGLD